MINSVAASKAVVRSETNRRLYHRDVRRALEGVHDRIVDEDLSADRGNIPFPLEFQRIYNGACTRLGEKEMNASANAFLDQIKANGELAKAYEKWMKRPLPPMPDSIEGVPFVAS